MVDFRYHALSLVAVFLALGIGIVLGVTVGDSLVSDADRNLRDSLRGDVTEARQEVRDEQTLGTKRDDVIEELAPEVAAGRLAGRRIALVSLGDLPVDVTDAVGDAVKMGDGRLVRTVQLRKLARGSARFVSRRVRGRADGVVLYRQNPPDDESDRDSARRERFSDAVVRRLGGSVIGVETFDTDPSQVGWYRDSGVPATIDDVDTAAGELGLVLLLSSADPQGSFGYKDSADHVLPDLSG